MNKSIQRNKYLNARRTQSSWVRNRWLIDPRAENTDWHHKARKAIRTNTLRVRSLRIECETHDSQQINKMVEIGFQATIQCG
jgi:hypothetical protein